MKKERIIIVLVTILTTSIIGSIILIPMISRMNKTNIEVSQTEKETKKKDGYLPSFALNKKNKKGEEIYDIEATIYCVRESHKGIIIGKNGEMLKKIGKYAREDMERNFGVKINLKTWVKVKKDWIDNQSIVNNKFKMN